MSDQEPFRKRRTRESNGLPHPSQIDRLPPHSIEAEQAVLGCILLDAPFALPVVTSLFRNEEDFYDMRHQVIYAKMVELADAKIPVNAITLTDKLRDANTLEPCGGLSYITALPDAAPTAAAVEYFAQIVVEKATQRRIISVCTQVVSKVYDAEGKDTDTLLSEAEQEILAIRRVSRKKGEPIKELVHQAVEVIERQHANQGQIAGISTGFSDLDKFHDGMHSDELIIVSGFPGAGKTTFAMNIMEHVAIDLKIPVGIFSFEMAPLQLTLRMIASRGRVNLRNIRDGFLAERDFPKITNAAGKIANAPIHIEKSSGMNVSQVRARARQMKMEHGIKLWLVDYTQIISESGRKDGNREREVANISRNLKEMASEFGDPVLALSQLNDDGKLRESRAIGQDADSIWNLERAESEEVVNETEVIPIDLKILKQRNGPSPLTVHLTFFKTFTRFESAAKITQGDYEERNLGL